jgi:hypothetical protein
MRTSPSALLPALLAAAALTLAGCQSSNPTSQAGGSAGEGQRLAFASPAAGAKVTSPVKVSFTVTGAQVGRPESGRMHLHVHVDNAGEYKILYAPQGQVEVPSGQHTLKAVLAQPNHSETAVSATRQVTVSGTGQAPASTSGQGGGYSYP